jgi:hypothetical protein
MKQFPIAYYSYNSQLTVNLVGSWDLPEKLVFTWTVKDVPPLTDAKGSLPCPVWVTTSLKLTLNDEVIKVVTRGASNYGGCMLHVRTFKDRKSKQRTKYEVLQLCNTKWRKFDVTPYKSLPEQNINSVYRYLLRKLGFVKEKNGQRTYVARTQILRITYFNNE